VVTVWKDSTYFNKHQKEKRTMSKMELLAKVDLPNEYEAEAVCDSIFGL